MKHKRLAAAVLAVAVVLAGCGSASDDAVPAGSGAAPASAFRRDGAGSPHRAPAPPPFSVPAPPP